MVAVLTLGFCLATATAPLRQGEMRVTGPTYRGVSYAAWTKDAFGSADSDKSLGNMHVDGVNAVAIQAWWFQKKVDSTTIAPDYTWYSSTDAALVHCIQQAHKLGMKVLLKPMVDPQDGNWRGQIKPSAAWFASYTAFIQHYAQIATAQKCEAFSVGCEYNANQADTADWQKVIAAVKAIYKGKLTYSANFDSYQNVGFWDSLDFVGIDAYFALTNVADPKTTDLATAWKNLANTIHNWQSANLPKKQVVFTEVGYASAKGANTHPWDWQSTAPVDTTEQVHCYGALLGTLWYDAWWGGAFWWNWETNPKAGGLKDSGYTPQNKPAEATLKVYYTKT